MATFPRDLKTRARDQGAGLVSVVVVYPDGRKVEERGLASASGCRFAEWAASTLFCPEVRAIPDLEAILRTAMGS